MNKYPLTVFNESHNYFRFVIIQNFSINKNAFLPSPDNSFILAGNHYLTLTFDSLNFQKDKQASCIIDHV